MPSVTPPIVEEDYFIASSKYSILRLYYELTRKGFDHWRIEDLEIEEIDS
jgi:hypothetical protein